MSKILSKITDPINNLFGGIKPKKKVKKIKKKKGEEDEDNPNKVLSNEVIRKSNESDWGGWAGTMVSSLVYSLIWLIVGSNLMYIHRYVKNGPHKDENIPSGIDLFPADPDQPPYSDGNVSLSKETLEKLKRISESNQSLLEKGKSAAQIGADFMKNKLDKRIQKFKNSGKSSIEKAAEKIKELKQKEIKDLYDFKYSNPYKFLKAKDSSWRKVVNDGIQGSYTTIRGLTNFAINYSGEPANLYEKDTRANLTDRIIFFLVTLFVIGFMFMSPFMSAFAAVSWIPLYGFFSTLGLSIISSTSNGLWHFIKSAVPGIPFAIIAAFGVAVAQLVQLLGTIFVLPFMISAKFAGKLIIENMFNALCVFLFFAGMNAYDYLDQFVAFGITVAIFVMILVIQFKFV